MNHELEAGYIVTCVGSVTQATIKFANQSQSTQLMGPFEIVSLTGTLTSAGGQHLHISLSDGTGITVGGHLMIGTLVYTTAEIILGEALDLTFSRQPDPVTTYNELVVGCRNETKTTSIL
eukprot:TRINITY_DN1373_c0_g1_i2.p1 TRINITY_DN1373_c0_g1~~TRINITY_DN1373_c0_g1_i2.p1  ORF type:complete len:120 (-),score=13.51 TRINITY_DN1373_c0_g1_i2:59-418(-)